MRKTCKCGNLLSDTTVPNKVVYWTVLISEKDKFVCLFHLEFPDCMLFNVWYCEHCKRFYHWGSDRIHYTYQLSEIIKKEECSIDWDSIENMYFSYNDFEEDEMSDVYEEKGILEYPRKVYGGTGFEQVFVLSGDQVKVYIIEEKVEIPGK